MFFRRLDYDERNIARYSTDSAARVNFGFPIGETQRINFGLSAEHTKITAGLLPRQEISRFIDDNGEKALLSKR